MVTTHTSQQEKNLKKKKWWPDLRKKSVFHSDSNIPLSCNKTSWKVFILIVLLKLWLERAAQVWCLKTAAWRRLHYFVKGPVLSALRCRRGRAIRGARSDRIWGISVVRLLPHHRPTDAEEIPKVAEDSPVKRVLLAPTVLQVGDPVTRHELPGGAVNGHQVEVAAQQQHHHHRENTNNGQRRQQEPVHSEPQLPWDAGWDARPEK